MKTGVLLVNLGTPDSPGTSDVRKYLREFLMDGRVIDIPYLNRFLLVNLIIAPFRAPKSAKLYKELWTEKGSPLLFHGLELQKLVQEALGDEYLVEFGMRYQSPSLQKALENLRKADVKKIIVLPMFPHYASASTGSVIEKIMELMKSWETIPQTVFLDEFCGYPPFINAFAALGKNYMSKQKYDHIIFSYHGLPERQILKGDNSGKCLKTTSCCDTFRADNRLCYRAQCFQTSRLLAEALGVSYENDCTVAFQSRLGSTPWIKPYTDLMIEELAGKGKKKILVFAPSFVADCLETTIEIGVEYKEVFDRLGGEHWQMVESLNTHPLWVEAVEKMVRSN